MCLDFILHQVHFLPKFYVTSKLPLLHIWLGRRVITYYLYAYRTTTKHYSAVLSGVQLRILLITSWTVYFTHWMLWLGWWKCLSNINWWMHPVSQLVSNYLLVHCYSRVGYDNIAILVAGADPGGSWRGGQMIPLLSLKMMKSFRKIELLS